MPQEQMSLGYMLMNRMLMKQMPFEQLPLEQIVSHQSCWCLDKKTTDGRKEKCECATGTVTFFFLGQII